MARDVTGSERAWGWLPCGDHPDREGAARRQRLLRALLAAYLPALALVGAIAGQGPATVVPYLALVLAACLAAGSGTARVQSVVTALGLGICSLATVVFTHGALAAHFPVFVMVCCLAVYQDWVPAVAIIVFTALSQGVLGAVAAGSLVGARAERAHPFELVALTTVFLLIESIALALLWRVVDDEASGTATLGAELMAEDRDPVRQQVAQGEALADLLTQLARRNQSLLNRQLARIDRLEQSEQDPESLARLFELDHLATRMRRSTETLLVLSGEEPPRRWGAPVPLAEIARGAVAEVEDYTRVDVLLGEDVLVDGRIVGAVVHLLAELVENATTFSPPASRVTIAGARTPDGGVVVTVTDAGVGITEADLLQANRTLAGVSQVSTALADRLGLHVIARLAARYGIDVWLGRAPGPGLVASAVLPPEVVSVVSGFDAARPAVSPVVPAPGGALPPRLVPMQVGPSGAPATPAALPL